LHIQRTLTYETSQMSILKWPKQPWLAFTDEGMELTPDAEEEELSRHFKSDRSYDLFDAKPDGRGPAPLVLLLFEGGVWRWPTIRKDYQRSVLTGVQLRTVSRSPAVFVVLFDLSSVESIGISSSTLSTVVTLAETRLGPSKINEQSGLSGINKTIRSSEQTFLEYGFDKELINVRNATGRLLRASPEQLQHFQVLRYTEGQHYDLHRDYWDPREFPDVDRFTNSEGFWHQRHATLLWYLSGPLLGGETWFPRAHGGPIPSGDWAACDERGVKVGPNNATAVLFYSLRADGDIDEHSWHCGCPVISGTKWAANSWLMNSPFYSHKRGEQISNHELREL